MLLPPKRERGLVTFIQSVKEWIRGKEQEDRPTDPVDTLYRSCHITAKCRYNASIRLKRLGSFSFFTATVLSLGLILLPLLQMANIPVAYPAPVLNMLQIFLAVAVLVYSVINSSAHYETRSEALNECGDNIKELSRQLRTQRALQADVDMDRMNERYTDISTDSENHTRADYWLAMLQARDIYELRGLPRLRLQLKVWVAALGRYFLPAGLMLIELLIVLDTLNVTSVFTPLLTGQR